ncbi:cytochrome P450 [Epithele typhae]|uniref:cytochrome P450 n=1 Tax=Epithele typhae TaxID=378194 RepID=UPI0020076017|nr:cytochrome P450 [Epithele typhae]KAH9935148.1 cytochrome P450 [Epithele typhae]
MDNRSPVVVLGVGALVFGLYRLWTRPSLSDVQGPQPKSFWLGNLPELFQEESGETEYEWLREYGGVARVKAPFGEDMLWISDPKALQYIFHTSGYNFPKQPERRVISRLIGDTGLTWAEGHDHQRQRKVMLPAFGSPESKALLPVFRHYAEQVTSKWKDTLAGTEHGAAEINVHESIAPATLEAIGEAAFDYKLGVLGNEASELGGAYRNLVASIFSSPSNARIFSQAVAHYIPMWIQDYIYDNIPSKGLEKARINRQAAHKVANELLEMKTEALLSGKEHRDVMSILVRENAKEPSESRLSHAEIVAQMRTLMLAGQETTSNTLSWLLRELAHQPAVQARLRAEIHAAERALVARGAAEFTVADFEAMPYLQAVLKEHLRFNPPLPHLFRQSARQDVLPLAVPLRTRSGRVVTELPIRAGLRVVLSICAYHRNPDVWGADADVFNPDRWLDASKARPAVNVGVYSNLLTFAGGVRGCIGWRFAIYELQAFLVELVSQFRFAPTDAAARVRRTTAIVTVPTIGDAVAMPLSVSLAPRDEDA